MVLGCFGVPNLDSSLVPWHFNIFNIFNAFKRGADRCDNQHTTRCQEGRTGASLCQRTTAKALDVSLDRGWRSNCLDPAPTEFSHVWESNGVT